MAKASISRLLSLRASINDAIDNYIVATYIPNATNVATQMRLAGAIADAAARVQEEVADPATKVMLLGYSLCLNFAVRVADELDIFSLLNDDGVELSLLTSKTGADTSLLRRILRILTAERYVGETVPGFYTATTMSRTLTNPIFRSWIKLQFSIGPALLGPLTDFLAANRYKEPTVTHNAVSLVNDGDGNFFNWIDKQPENRRIFDNILGFYNSLPPELTPLYDFLEDNENFEPSDVLLVDMGGNRGHYINTIRKRSPGLKGRIILQELPIITQKLVAEEIDLTEPRGFGVMTHDFFQPQPVMGAKYYSFRAVFHDWDDENCLEILRNLRDAMKPGHSKLLISDAILPEMGSMPLAVYMDLYMMTLGGKERCEPEWRELLAKGGFRINRIVRAQVGHYGVIEAELDQ